MANRELVWVVTSATVRKSAFNGGDKLREEISWILSLPPHLAIHFPQILSYSLNKHDTYYYMPFYNFPTLRQLVLQGSDVSSVFDVLGTALDFIVGQLYPYKQFLPTSDYFARMHLGRTRERMDEASLKSELYAKLLRPQWLQINGKRFRNLGLLLDDLESALEQGSLKRRLSPSQLFFIHGDLHFDNMLVEMRRVGRPNFILIDPRGFEGGEDIAYDLGKLWHSFHGLYDLIHSDRFQLVCDWSDSSCPSFQLKFEADLVQRYTEIGSWVRSRLTHLVRDDHEWEFRTKFSEACHFASLGPFHFHTEQRLVALHLQAVRLLTDCLAEPSVES